MDLPFRYLGIFPASCGQKWIESRGIPHQVARWNVSATSRTMLRGWTKSQRSEGILATSLRFSPRPSCGWGEGQRCCAPGSARQGAVPDRRTEARPRAALRPGRGEKCRADPAGRGGGRAGPPPGVSGLPSDVSYCRFLNAAFTFRLCVPSAGFQTCGPLLVRALA